MPAGDAVGHVVRVAAKRIDEGLAACDAVLGGREGDGGHEVEELDGLQYEDDGGYISTGGPDELV